MRKVSSISLSIVFIFFLLATVASAEIISSSRDNVLETKTIDGKVQKVATLSVMDKYYEDKIEGVQNIFIPQVEANSLYLKEGFFKGFNIVPTFILDNNEYSLSKFKDLYPDAIISFYTSLDKDISFGLAILKLPEDLKYKVAFSIDSNDYKDISFKYNKLFLNDTLNIDFSKEINAVIPFSNASGNFTKPAFIHKWNEDKKRLEVDFTGNNDYDPTISLKGTSGFPHDADVDRTNPTQTFGTSTDCNVNLQEYCYFMPDLTTTLATCNVDSVNASLFLTARTAGTIGNFDVRDSVNTSWDGDNANKMIWNNKAQENLTASYTYRYNATATNGSDGSVMRLEVTSIIKSALMQSKQNATIILNLSISNGTAMSFFTRNIGTALSRPELNVTCTVINSIPTATYAAINYTNATLFYTGENINASVTINDTDSTDKINGTAILFVNRKANLTLQYISNAAPNKTISIVFNNTNIIPNDVVNVQWNVTDGIDVSAYINSTAVTVQQPFSLSSLSWRTTNGTAAQPVNIFQALNYINVNATDNQSANVSVNISIFSPSGFAVVNNASVNNNSASNFTYTNLTLLNETGIWTIRSFAYNGISLLQASSTFNVSSPILRVSITANSSASSSTQHHFIANLTLDKTGLRVLSGIFGYNNTFFTSNITSINNTSSEARDTIIIPISTTAATKSFSWNFTFDFGSNSYETNTTTTTQTINPIGFKTCSGGDLIAFNFTHRDEDNQTTLKGDFEGTFIVYQNSISTNITLNFTETNVTSHPICLIDNSTTLKTDATIKYSVFGYDPKYFYFFNETVDNVTDNISIFSLPISLADSIILEATDETGVGIPDVIIKVQRYYVGENQYKTVAMTKTGPDGRDVTFIRFNDVAYRFLLFRNNVLTLQTEDQKVSSTITMLTFRLVPSSIKDILTTFERITWNLSVVGLNFSLEYDDPTGRSNLNCLIVTKRYQLNDTELARKCSSAAHAKFSYLVPNQTGKYFGVYYSTINPESYQDNVVLEILDETLSEAVRFGKTGLLMGSMIVTTLAAVGSWNPIAAILFGTLGFFATGAFGLVVIKWAFLIGVILAALIAVFKLKT